MYLFNRTGRVANGNTRKTLEWATGITEKVRNVSGLEVGLFQQVFSPEFGTIVWSTFVPDLQSLEAATDKLIGDDGFVQLADEGAKFTEGGFDDGLFQVLHGEPDPSRQVEYVVVVRSVCSSGNFAKGFEVGMEVAQRAERVTGTPTLFLAAATGDYGAVGWVTGFSDIKALEAGQGALATDASFAEYIDGEASNVYVSEPWMTTQRIFRRIV